MKSMKRFSIFCLLILLVLALACGGIDAAVAAPVEGEYMVLAEILPIMKSPSGEYQTYDEDEVQYLEYNEDIDGVVVYGNRLKLKPEEGTSDWLALLSPEDGEILGYVPRKGVEILPDYAPTDGAFYMAARDNPDLSLSFDPPSGKTELPGRDFSLLKGEVVRSLGRRGEKILLSFGTTDGEQGVGGRCAWAGEKDFIALASYEPDNTKADRALIPSSRRLSAGGNGGETVERLPESVIGSLEKRGFQIGDQPLLSQYVTVDDMADRYAMTAPYEADFITTDIFLHSFHLIFDQMLQKFERTFLAPNLKGGLWEAIDILAEQGNAGTFTNPEAKKALGKVFDLISVALWLLEGDPGDKIALTEASREEVDRILSASAVAESPITGQKIDYTLFKPRGHYTISPEFERYFQAMNYIGLAELPLFGKEGKPIAENVMTVAILSIALDGIETWEKYEDAVGFLVGAPNAGDPKRYREIVRKRLGAGKDAWRLLGDESAMAALAKDIAENMPGPKIQSVLGIDTRPGADFDNRDAVFRISPKRFTYDAYILNRLTSPRVGTQAVARNMPKGTDVMAVFGSPVADALSKADYDVENYEANLARLKEEVSGYLAGENTVYARWLEAFRAGFADSGSEQFFYRSEGWRWKKLATNLASWAELKHDTILYAEQSAAEYGEGGDWLAGRFAPPFPRGYVEPDPQFFAAMSDAVGSLRTFIQDYGVEDLDAEGETSYTERLDVFSDKLTKMRDIARKEVDKETLSSEEYEEIKETAQSFNTWLLLPGEHFENPMDDGERRKMACMADVHTDGFDGEVLETAVGVPRAIYVFANDQSGGARVTKGYVFSYYEFAQPMTKRMTDEDWRAIVYDPARADELEGFRPSWHEEFKKNTQ